MAVATVSIAELTSLMQQNLDAINYHLARISDTKAHDDEIERLENERQKRADMLSTQLAREVKELEEKRKQLGGPAAEKRRQEHEKIVAMRAQEERDLATARRKEDEEILARRLKEDAVRRARREQEDEELRSVAQKQEEQIKAMLAGEEERKKREAAERENSLYEEFDVQMTYLEDEMEKKVVESTKILAELDEKRKAISAQIDAQMKPARRPTFRRGSKRYSIAGLAADVATMLGGKPSLERKSTLSQIDEQTRPVHTEIPRDIPTPARSDHTTSSRMSYAGSIRSFASEDAEDIKAREEMARINAEIMAEREAERAGTPQQTDKSRSIHRVSPSSASIGSVKSEDPEDVRAREEMARINAEIIAAAAVEEHARPSTTPKFVQRESDEDTRAREEVARLNAKIIKERRLSKQMQQVQALQIPQVTSHQRLPTWVNQAKLAIVKGSHGVLRFGKEGADMKIVDARKADEPTRPQKPTRILEPFVYSGQMHALLPTWADQATLPIVSGSHGVLKFENDGTRTALVSSLQRHQLAPRESKHGHLPTWADQSKLELVSGSWGMLAFRQEGADMVVVEPPREKAVSMPAVALHNHLPTWANQSKLAAVNGAWGMLVFRDGGADMKVMRVEESEEPEEQSSFSHEPIRPLPAAAIVPEALWFGKLDSLNGHPDNSTTRSISPDLTSHMLVKTREPDLQEQRCPILNGLGGATMNRGQEKHPKSAPEHTAANIVVVEAVGEQYDLNHPALRELVQAVHTNGDLYWAADQGKLPIVRGSHGSLEFGQHGAELKVTISACTDRYWAGNQSKLALVRGSYGSLRFSATGAAMKVVNINPYWVDQSTLGVVMGDHGFLTFEGNESAMKVRKGDSYWVDQRTLAVVKGSHGRLAFNADGAKLEIVRPDPYWVDQSTLVLITGTHGRLSFGEGGAALKVGDPYGVDQRTLPIVKGSHGQLIFGAIGAEIGVIRHDPYWEDQRMLSVVRGSHGKLTFTSNGAAPEVVRPDPYWVDQSTLAMIEGSHGRLAFGADGSSVKVVRADPYWSANQKNLDLMMGKHAMLRFDARRAKMEIAGSKYSYLAANQAGLKIVRGSHGVLVFNASGASQEIAAPKHPYWATNQASLKVLRGSHGMLVFNASGASLEVPRALNVYWNANQASLKTIQGSHGSLHFEDEGETVHIVQPTSYYWMTNQSILPIIQGSHGMLVFNESGASIEVETPPTRYWAANQAKLKEVRGSHGTLHFIAEGSTIQPSSVPEEKPTHHIPLPTPNPSSYQADQRNLSQIQENNSTHVLHTPLSTNIPHTNPQLPTSLETGDFFPDSSDSEEDQFPLPPNRTSFGYGTFSSLLNNVKDRVPIVTNLVGNGSYSSFEQDEDSPLTPTNEENPALIKQEAIIHYSPESSQQPRHQERDFERGGTRGFQEEREDKLSPLPTQSVFEFDPVFHQRVAVRSPISTKPFESVSGRRLGSNNPFQANIQGRRVDGGREVESVIERMRGVFEKGDGGRS